MSIFATMMAGVMIMSSSGGRHSKLLNPTIKPNGGISTYKGGNYCGPGWGFTYKDVLDGTISKLPKAIDAIDEACKAHDYCYEENGYFTQGCNLVVTYDLVQVVVGEQSSPSERLDAAIMAAVFYVESQSWDVVVLTAEQATKMWQRIHSFISIQGATFETAIKKELNARGAGIPH